MHSGPADRKVSGHSTRLCVHKAFTSPRARRRRAPAHRLLKEKNSAARARPLAAASALVDDGSIIITIIHLLFLQLQLTRQFTRASNKDCPFTGYQPYSLGASRSSL